MNEQREAIRFLAVAMGLYLLWYFIYEQWLCPDGQLDTWLSEQEAGLSGFLLHIFGFGGSASGAVVKIQGYKVVGVGNPCNGMVLFALFAGFILAYPGSWRIKCVYIPAGILAIFILNITRIVVLALNSFYNRSTLDFNHKYTFAFVVYTCIFGFWMLWIKHYGKPLKNSTAS